MLVSSLFYVMWRFNFSNFEKKINLGRRGLKMRTSINCVTVSALTALIMDKLGSWLQNRTDISADIDNFWVSGICNSVLREVTDVIAKSNSIKQHKNSVAWCWKDDYFLWGIFNFIVLAVKEDKIVNLNKAALKPTADNFIWYMLCAMLHSICMQ